MSFLDFIVNNYLNIILITILVLSLFISHEYKSKGAETIIVLLSFSFLHVVLNYILRFTKAKIFVVSSICIVILMVIYLYSIYITKPKLINHIVYTIPLIVCIPLIFAISRPALVTLIGCSVYLTLHLLCAFINLKEKNNVWIYILLCSLGSMVSLLIDYISGIYSLLNGTLIISTIIIFIQHFIQEESKRKIAQEKLVQDQKTSIAISQIQPHFLYNSLATIGYLCKNDPQTASNAIDKFSDYLRANLNSLAQMSNVPFKDELRHVETYLWLEKLRFEDRLEVEYDIQVSDFLVPSLSIQPLVENAVKHGICSKVEGGKITIRTIPYNEYIKIVIEDDGVGFDDSQTKKKDGKTHVGIENVKSRIKSMADGSLEIISQVGKGTISTITLPRR